MIIVFFLTKSIVMNIELYPYFPSSQVSISRPYKSDYRKEDILKSNKIDLMLKITAGKSQYNDENANQKAMEKLRKSIISKNPQSLRENISINKFLKMVLKTID